MGQFRRYVNRWAGRRAGRGLVLGVALVGLGALAGCVDPPVQRGNLPEPDKLAQIKPGKTDKATVSRLLGSPSSVAPLDGKTWFYISQKTELVAFLKPQIVDQQVIAIDFDDKGVVRNIEARSLADSEPIVPNPNATPAPGREFSFLEQLIGNFGRFNTDKDKGQATTSGH